MAGQSISDLARSIIAATASDAGPQLALNWINERYREMVARVGFHQLRKYGSVNVSAPITAGTVNVTQGSTTAVLSTALANNTAQLGWTIRAANVWFVVTAINADKVTLTLDSAYSESSNTAASYNLVQRYVAVQPTARWISQVAHPRRRRMLTHVLLDQLNAKAPSRQLVAAFPWCWTEASRFVEGTDISGQLGTAGQKLIEIYPPSSIEETYLYTYWDLPTAFALSGTNSTLPPEVDEFVLREGVLIDYYRYESQKAARANNIEAANYFSNMEARQRTIWEQKIQNAIVTDAAYKPGLSIELDTFTYAAEFDSDIVTAHDFVVNSWTQ